MTAYIQVIIRVFLTLIAGGLIGKEREAVHKPAGIRTHMLVCTGAALYVIITLEQLPGEVAWIIAGVATGIGFLGAGTIFKSKDEVHGLTTAASIWTVAVIGMSIGLGYYVISLIAFIATIFTLHLKYFKFLEKFH